MPTPLQCLLLLSSMLGGPLVIADEAGDIGKFNAAYTAYREYQERGDTELAVAEARVAFETGRKIFGDHNLNTTTLAYNYGRALIDIGNSEDGRKILQETIVLYEGYYGRNSPDLIPVLMDLGSANAATSNPRQQKQHYDRALRLARDHYGRNSESYGRLLVSAAIGIKDRSLSSTSKKYLLSAYPILLDTPGKENTFTGIAAFHLARSEIGRNRYRKAEGYLLVALDTFDDPSRPSSPLELSVHAALVSVYENLGKSDKATIHCQAIGRMTPSNDDQDYFPLFRRAPRYPMSALSERKAGYAIVEFTVDHEGIVRDPVVVEVDGRNLFEDASIEAVSAFRYAPRFIDGKPIATANVRTKISFKLE